MNGHCQNLIKSKETPWNSTTSVSYKIRYMDRESMQGSKRSQMYHKCRQVEMSYGISGPRNSQCFGINYFKWNIKFKRQYRTVIKSTDFGARLPGFEYWFCYLITMWLLGKLCNFLCLSSTIYKMGIILSGTHMKVPFCCCCSKTGWILTI